MPAHFEDDDDLPQRSGSSNSTLWIVLAVVGGVLFIIAAPFVLCCGFGSLMRPIAGPGGPAAPVMVSSSTDFPNEEVFDLGQEAAVGDVTVKVVSAKIGPVPTKVPGTGKAGVSDKAYLVITVEIQNGNPNNQMDFTPWFDNAATSCTDNNGFINLPTDICDNGGKRLLVVGQQIKPVRLMADKPVTDKLVFDNPGAGVQSLILTLPAASVGDVTGRQLLFRIGADDLR